MNESIHVGDRVRIVHGYYGAGGTVVDGWIGTVTRVDTHKTPIQYHVRIADTYNDIRVAREVEALTPAEPEPAPAEVLIDAKRLQAARAAHEILGSDALLEDLIGVAEFVLGEHKDAAAKRTTVGTVYVDVKADTSALVEEIAWLARTAPAVASDESLEIEDADGDWVKTEYLDSSERPHIAHITSSDEGAYLTADGVDSLIARLQQFKAKAAQA